MTKMKTKKGIKKRFKVTGTKKLKRTRPGRRHLLSKKPSKRKRKLRKRPLMDKSQQRTYSRLIGV